MERLREEVARTYFENMSEALANPDPEMLERMRNAFDALNRMIEQREAGEPLDPSFESFMEQLRRHVSRRSQGPRRAARADGCAHGRRPGHVELHVPRAAGPAAGPGRQPARGHGPALAGRPAGGQPPQRLPGRGWGRRYSSGATEPDGHWRRHRARPSGCATSTTWRASSGRRNHPASLVRGRPGQGPAPPRRRCRPFTRPVGQSDQATDRRRPHRHDAKGGSSSRRKGIRRHRPSGPGRPLLAADQGPGGHAPHHLDGHRARSRGDDQAVRIRRPVQPRPVAHRAQRRAPGRQRRAGAPAPDDFEVIETEALTRSATVLLLDLSLSMPMRDNFVPAKKMALALHTLITSRFPRDYLGLVGFSEVARVIEPEDLPTVSWDYVYGTNLQHGLMLARKMLAHQQGTKQIILVTDGEPTAHIVPDDAGLGYDVFFNYPPVPETLEVTLAEVMRCTKAGITINTFLLDPDRGPARLHRPAHSRSTGAGPSPPRRTSSATTCSWTSCGTRRRCGRGADERTERPLRSPRAASDRFATPGISTVRRTHRSDRQASTSTSDSVPAHEGGHVCRQVFHSPSSQVTGENGAQSEFLLAFPQTMVKDDISVVTAVPCDRMNSGRRHQWEGGRVDGPDVSALRTTTRANVAEQGQLHGGRPRPVLPRAGRIHRARPRKCAGGASCGTSASSTHWPTVRSSGSGAGSPNASGAGYAGSAPCSGGRPTPPER